MARVAELDSKVPDGEPTWSVVLLRILSDGQFDDALSNPEQFRSVLAMGCRIEQARRSQTP